MKKAGILTFHFSTNFGAVLQCYALRKTISSLGEIKSDVLNYIPATWEKPIFFDPETNKKYAEQIEKFDKFRRDAVGIETAAFSEFTADAYSGYDFFVAGSDQIWNIRYKSDSNYFLDFAPKDTVKIAYAASVGTPVSKIGNLAVEDYRKFIPEFDFLSVRERTHEKFIQQFTDKEVTTVLDPTLLLNAADYEKLLINPIADDKYILLYFLNHDLTAPFILSFANKISIKHKLKVRHSFVELPSNALKNDGGSFKFSGVEEFLGLVKNAEMVITNSFHGTVFSILFGKPFYTFITKSIASRIYDLLDSLGLSARIVDSYKPLGDVSFDLDFSHAYLRIKEMRNHSMKFLKTALGVCDR